MRLDEMKLAIAMVKKGFNIATLAKESGVSRNTISAAKAGKRIRPEIVAKISLALEVEATEIIE